MTKEQYIIYLQKTLIPDLLESGSVATAFDFAKAVRFLMGVEVINDYFSDSGMAHYCRMVCQLKA